MRVYIWMEGTDADCVNNAAAEDPATYNVNVKLAGISIVINNFMVSGLASRSITDNAGWHTQNTQIFYPAILTYEKLYGILFLIKIEII